jgi:hypothetical protein
VYGLKNSLTSTTGSHAKLLLDDASSAMPVGGPRKLSQTSRNRDSSASLQLFHHNLCLVYANSSKLKIIQITACDSALTGKSAKLYL